VLQKAVTFMKVIADKYCQRLLTKKLLMGARDEALREYRAKEGPAPVMKRPSRLTTRTTKPRRKKDTKNEEEQADEEQAEEEQAEEEEGDADTLEDAKSDEEQAEEEQAEGESADAGEAADETKKGR
jgi:hypothetical protein